LHNQWIVTDHDYVADAEFHCCFHVMSCKNECVKKGGIIPDVW